MQKSADRRRITCNRFFFTRNNIINEQSEFFRGLSENSEHEGPDPARPITTLLRCLYLWECVSDCHTAFIGDWFLQATLITVGFGSFWGVTLARSACPREGCQNWSPSNNSGMARRIVTKFDVSLATKYRCTSILCGYTYPIHAGVRMSGPTRPDL